MKTSVTLILILVLFAGCAAKSESENDSKRHSNGVIEDRLKPLSKTDSEAVAAIKKLGGKVTTINRSDGIDTANDRGIKIIGRQMIVVKVRLSGPNVSDAALVHLKGLKTLYDVSLSKSAVSDVGLIQLKGLKNLQFLDLNGTKVTDAGLVHLENLNKLVFVDLRSTTVTDIGLKKLRVALPNCRSRR